MKITIEKLPSGNYRIRKTINGKRVSIVYDHKPKQKEIEADLLKKANSPSNNGSKTFKKFADEFISINTNVLKPSTLRGYQSIINALPEYFLNYKIDEITNADIQSLINQRASEVSPKTLKNMRGFISTVMKMYRPEFAMNVKVPQSPVVEKYIPTAEEVQDVLSEVKGTQFEITFRVMMYGLRRGEVIALQIPDDLTDDNILSINKAYSMDMNNKMVLMDTPKTNSSNRKIRIDAELADMIRKQGYVYRGDPTYIYDKLQSIQKKLGQQHWRLHDFRSYMATELNASGVDEATIMAIGGWSTPNIMKRTYRKSRYEQDKSISDKVIDVLSSQK